MDRRLLGLVCGVVFGIADVVMTVSGNLPDLSRSMLLQAFTSRLAIGVLAANVTLGMDRIFAGALTGLLVSLPDAFALNSYIGVLGTGLLFGGLAGWLSKTLGK